MGKIIGDQNTIKQARTAKDNVYINWDAIDSLPEQFEAVVTKVTFDPKKDWVEVGNGNNMPNPDVVYDIAKACGISGVSHTQIEPMYMDVNYNELERLPGFNAIKICVGYKSVKQSFVIAEDGTRQYSSPCSAVYNAWDRALNMWTKEEKYTDGYSKKGKYLNKYESKYDRKAHFYDLMKFAQKVAETQAFFKTIRELAGLKTGYKMEDLKDGYMVFYKIRKSERSLKLEQAAHLKAIEGGSVSMESQDLLFGNSEPMAQIEDNSEVVQHYEKPVKDETFDDYDESSDNQTDMFDVPTPDSLASDLESILSTISEKERCQKMIDWLKTDPDMNDEKNKAAFNRALDFYRDNEIPFD